VLRPAAIALVTVDQLVSVGSVSMWRACFARVEIIFVSTHAVTLVGSDLSMVASIDTEDLHRLRAQELWRLQYGGGRPEGCELNFQQGEEDASVPVALHRSALHAIR
jgi:hypothetical protein